jgi:hypothetical protein
MVSSAPRRWSIHFSSLGQPAVYPIRPELLQREFKQRQISRLTRGVIQQNLHQFLRHLQTGHLRRTTDHGFQRRAIQRAQVNERGVGQAGRQGLVVQNLAPNNRPAA